jgi:hypothetical protein
LLPVAAATSSSVRRRCAAPVRACQSARRAILANRSVVAGASKITAAVSATNLVDFRDSASVVHVAAFGQIAGFDRGLRSRAADVQIPRPGLLSPSEDSRSADFFLIII